MRRFWDCAKVYDQEFSEYLNSLPHIHHIQKGSIVVVALTERIADTESVIFVPVRHLTKGSKRFICAYCDNILQGSCHHTRTISIILEHGQMSEEFESHTTRESESSFDGLGSAISRLPLAPVNCAKAVQVDEYVCNLARASKSYLLKAPISCLSCGSPRNEGTRQVLTDGVLTCSIGPCKLKIERYKCSSTLCSEVIVSEGREHCIVLENTASGATHSFLRRELYGVVVSNGTLTGRLRHFHSSVTANAFFGVIPATPLCRSVKTLAKLCSLMLKLMCMSPSATLFQCRNCESKDLSSRGSMRALCMDGISQGYLRTGSNSFQNVSEECVALKASTMLTKGRASLCVRPLTCLVREARPVSILLNAIRGKRLECNKVNEKDFVSALRLVSVYSLPDSFYSSVSVCGTTRGDVSNDIGENCTLSRLRKLITSIFNEKTLLLRLLQPLHDFVHDDHVRKYIEKFISQLLDGTNSQSSCIDICWRGEVLDCTDSHIQNDIFILFKMLIQGPVPQFVRKSDATSLNALASICSLPKFDELSTTLSNPNEILRSNEQGNTNVLSSLKVLRAGLFSVLQVERTQRNAEIRLSFGGVLSECFQLLMRFNSFYDNKSRMESAFVYRDRWSSTDHGNLKSKMDKRYQSCEIMNGTVLEIACRTGAYFPGRPQIRPLPFNDEEISHNEFETVDLCSKDFIQRQNSFTPGALTFCCSCAHPKILGFKILHRNEGPRAILDTVISRFANIPRFLIYDFCCGLFVSAIHCFWWAIANVAIVCDNFHAKNHSCSPGYNPKVHDALHATNTVAHEQRNRAIQRLGLSLRNCKLHLYVSLLGYQTIVLNIRAQAKGTQEFESRPQSIFDFDIEWCYFNCLNLRCTCCPPE